MPAAARKNDTANHVPAGGFTVHKINEGSGNVNINSKPAARKGDDLTDHLKPGNPPVVHFPDGDTPVVPNISGGSSTVFINGKAAARKGDAINCSSKILDGSGNVNIGG
jgi:uncharacterized Zn-binding protein involved in type VI secretion